MVRDEQQTLIRIISHSAIQLYRAVSLHASTRRADFRSTFLKILLAVNLVMYFVFILLFILYEAAKGTKEHFLLLRHSFHFSITFHHFHHFLTFIIPSVESVVCEGLIAEMDQTARRSISIAYRSMITIIGTIIAAIFLSLGTTFHVRSMCAQRSSFSPNNPLEVRLLR